MLEISESTSKTQLFKARKKLQTLINKENKISYGTH
jgi:DNA-directed RNA polymerase specialized sigma24 family protein